MANFRWSLDAKIFVPQFIDSLITEFYSGIPQESVQPALVLRRPRTDVNKERE
jgi:hypothetical protein